MDSVDWMSQQWLCSIFRGWCADFQLERIVFILKDISHNLTVYGNIIMKDATTQLPPGAVLA